MKNEINIVNVIIAFIIICMLGLYVFSYLQQKNNQNNYSSKGSYSRAESEL